MLYSKPLYFKRKVCVIRERESIRKRGMGDREVKNFLIIYIKRRKRQKKIDRTREKESEKDRERERWKNRVRKRAKY